MNNTAIFKDFDELQRSITESRKAWENGTNAQMMKKADTYHGIWKELNRSRFFWSNEYKDAMKRFKESENTFASAVIASRQQAYNDEHTKMTAAATASYRFMIKEFTKKQHDNVRKMVRTAPTESMRNLLEVLKMRDDLSQVELQDILPCVYDNYNALKTLETIARQNGVTLTVPVQLDCVEMHKAIDKAHDYLMGACDELFKPKDKTIHYKDFFTVNPDEPDKIFSPVYADYVSVLDTVPQLQDVSAKKSGLSISEKQKIDWYFRDLPENANKTRVAEFVRDVMQKHPEDIPLLKLSQYAESVEIVEAAEKKNKRLSGKDKRPYPTMGEGVSFYHF